MAFESNNHIKMKQLFYKPKWTKIGGNWISVGVLISQGSKLAVAWSPNASENSGERVKTLPLLARWASQKCVPFHNK